MRAAAAAIGRHPDVARVSPPQLSADGDAGMLTMVPRSSPQDAATEELVHDLRDDLLPSTLGQAGLASYVGGGTASLLDQSEHIAGRLPLFIAGVVTVSFLLSRVREEFLQRGSTSEAVTAGLARTARVITAAAAIMVVVFSAIAVSNEVFLRLIGVGMATAIPR